MIDVTEITDLQSALVARWHEQPVDNPHPGFLGIVCQQLSYNFLLWHEEDIARSPAETDARIAQVKRHIDRYNQQRNDWMERLDDWLTEYVRDHGRPAAASAPLNTESPGSVIDRLSILALRIYHLEEQLARPDASDEHRHRVAAKLAVCREQREDLKLALAELLDDILAGRKRHKTYRHLKMYNDATLNPYLYRSPPQMSGKSP